MLLHPKRLTRRVCVAFIAIVSMSLGLVAAVAAFEWGLTGGRLGPVAVISLLVLLPVPSLTAFVADRHVCRTRATPRGPAAADRPCARQCPLAVGGSSSS